MPVAYGGKGYGSAAVYNILRNETYIGRFYAFKYIRTKKLRTMRPKEEWACISVPAVVPDDLFQEAQRMLDQGKKLSPRNSNHEYLMARRLTCTCGYAVRTVTTSWRLYYACRSEHKAKGRCTLPYFYADNVDEQVRWATEVKTYLERHEADFTFKLECIQTLDLKGKLAFENDEKVLYLHWCMREYRIVTESGSRLIPLRP